MNLKMDEHLATIFSVLETMQNALKCSICLDLLNNPVTTKCGHSFCGYCADKIFSGAKGAVTCPLCMAAMTKRSLKQNKKIVSLVDAVRNVIASVKDDVGYDDSHRKRKDSAYNEVNSATCDINIQNSDATLRRGSRKREQVLAAVVAKPVDNQKKQVSGKMDFETSHCVSDSAKVIDKLSTTDSNNRRQLNKSAKKANILSDLDNCNLRSECLQFADDLQINYVENSQERTVKKKVEDWLDKRDSAKCDANILDDAFGTTQVFSPKSNDIFSSKTFSNLDSADLCDLPENHQMEEKDCVTASQATTVLFTTDLHLTDLKSLTQNDLSLKDCEKQPSTNVAVGDFEMSEEKENNIVKVDPLEKSDIIVKRGCKRVLSETNIAINNTKKNNLNEKSKGRSCSSAILNKRSADTLEDTCIEISSTCVNFSDELNKQNHPNSKGHNIRFASEIKCKLLEKPVAAKLTVGKRNRKSPGWSHIENVKKDLRSKHTSLRIKGGAGKHINDMSKIDTLSSVIPDLSQESVIVIEDQSQVSLGRQEEAGRFKRFKNAFSFKGKNSGEAKEEAQPPIKFKRRTKLSIPRCEKKKSNFEYELSSELNVETGRPKLLKKLKNSDILPEIVLADEEQDLLQGCSVFNKSVNPTDSYIVTVSKLENNELCESPKTCKRAISSRLTRSKYKETVTDDSPSFLEETNELPGTEKPEKENNLKLIEKPLDRSIQLKDKLWCNNSSTGTCRRSFDLGLGLSHEPPIQQNNSVAYIEKSLIDMGACLREDAYVKEKDEDYISSAVDNDDGDNKSSDVKSCKPVLFQRKGNLCERDSSSCHHSLPCDMFQSLMKFSHFMTSNYSSNGSCYSKVEASQYFDSPNQMLSDKINQNVSATTPYPKNSNSSLNKSASLKKKIDSPIHDDPTLTGALLLKDVGLSSFSKLTESVRNQNAFAKNELVKSNVSKESSVKNTGELGEVIQDVAVIASNISVVSQRKINFSPLISPTSPLQPSFEKGQNSKGKSDGEVSLQHSQLSLSMLHDIEKTSPSDVYKCNHTVKEPSLYFTLSQPQQDKEKETFELNFHPVERPCTSNENSNHSSTHSSPLCSSFPTPTNRKTFRRINTLDSSDSSSCEDLDNIQKTKKTRKANIESQTPTSSIADLPNSEELRDFARYDENIWNYYRNSKQSQFDKNIKSSLLTVNLDKNKAAYSKENDLIQLISLTRFNQQKELSVGIISDEDDEFIPGTEEVLKCATADIVFKNQNDYNSIETINLTSQEPSTAASSHIELPLSTKNLFKKCDESLNMAEKIITDKFAEKELIDGFNKDLEQDIFGIQESGEFGKNESPETSNHSIVIPSQQKRKIQHESHKKSSPAEAISIQKSSDFTPGSQKSLQKDTSKTCNQVSSNAQFFRDSNPDSEELFKSISNSVLQLDAKKANHRNRLMLPVKQKENVMVVYTGLSNLEVNKVHKFVESVCHPGTQISNIWTKEVSHVIAKTDADGITERTLKYLYGVAYGVWVVSFSWVIDSLNSSVLLPEENYEVLDCTGYPGPNRGRNRISPIFENCQFCLVPPFANITEEQFIELIKVCGGDVVSDAYNFNELAKGLKLVAIDSDSVLDVNVLEDVKRCGKVLVAHDWLIECIGMCALVAISSYIFGDPTEREVRASGVTEALLCETQDIP